MANAVKKWFESLTDVRRDEIKPVVLMFLYGFLAMTSYYVVKPARNAVFVERLGAENLPYVYVATAVFVSAVMVVYSRYVHKIGRRTLLLGTFAFLASNLVGFRWLLLGYGDAFWVSGSFYIWGKLYPLLLVSQFWLVGNLLLTTRQAKRLFGPIGLGLILGGVAGSTISGTAAQLMGTEDLLLLAAGVLGGCAVIVLALMPETRSERTESGRLVEDLSGDAIRLLLESNHLRWIATILGVTIVVTTMVDWQFNRAVELFISGEDAKTQFFGRFFLGLNIASVSIQLLLTAFVLRRFGIGVALLALPLGLLVTTMGIFAVPALITATLAKGTEGALRYSLDQSTRELLYLPVPNDVKYKVKPLIDLAIYRGGTGLGGILLLVVTNWLGFGLRGVAVVCALLIGVWVLATFRMKHAFKESVKRLIGVRDVSLRDLVVEGLEDAESTRLQQALECGDEDEALYGLGILRHRDPRAFTRELTSLLGHESAELRRQALVFLRDIGYEGAGGEARALLVDPELAVRVAALEYVCTYATDDPAGELADALASDRKGLRAAAVAVALRSGGVLSSDDELEVPEPDALRRQGVAALDRLCQEENLERRAEAAQVLLETDLGSEEGLELLRDLLERPDPAIRWAAMQAAANLRSDELLPVLLDRLAVPRDRDAAVNALARRAPDIRDLLFERLHDPEGSIAERTSIPRILRPTADQETVDRLVEALDRTPPRVRFEILKTLAKIRLDQEELDFERYDLEPLVSREVDEAYLWARRCHMVSTESPDSFLARILTQRMEEAAERAFRTLGLQHPMDDLEAAFVALRSDEEIMRQRGFELADNALPHKYRPLFDPLLNPDKGWEDRLEAAEERFDVARESREEVLEAVAAEDGICAPSLARLELSGEPLDRIVTPEELREEVASRINMILDTPHLEEGVPIMDVLERAEILSRTRVFRDLRGEELAGVAALMEVRSYGAGDTVAGEAGQGGDLHVVVEGRLGARDGETLLYGAGPEQAFFDPAFLDGREAEVEAVALEKSKVLSISRPAFMQVLEERFGVVQGLMAHLARLAREGGFRVCEEALQEEGAGGDRAA